MNMERESWNLGRIEFGTRTFRAPRTKTLKNKMEIGSWKPQEGTSKAIKKKKTCVFFFVRKIQDWTGSEILDVIVFRFAPGTVSANAPPTKSKLVLHYSTPMIAFKRQQTISKIT